MSIEKEISREQLQQTIKSFILQHHDNLNRMWSWNKIIELMLNHYSKVELAFLYKDLKLRESETEGK